jgi:glycosyltransferase involved in cell wall biosynthesis
MRSLHVITSTARRGAETFAVELVEHLSSLGEDARVVALTRAERGFAVPWLGAHRRSPQTLYRLRRYAGAADVVVAHGSSTLEACAVALAGSATPFVYRSIGDPRYWVRSSARRQALGVLHRRAGRHVALWQDAAAELERRYRIGSQRIDVIPNAVPGDRWSLGSEAERAAARAALGVELGQPCLAFVGALSPEKDVGAVLASAPDVPGAVVLIAGDGPERPRLERGAAELAPGRVRFLGAVTDPRPVYLAADLLLLPSLSEGMPGVIIEAGLVGTATVASAVGAVPEMIEDGRTGFLSQPGQHDDLGEVVRAALPEAASVGERAAEGFRHRYTIDRVADDWVATMEAAGRPGPGS